VTVAAWGMGGVLWGGEDVGRCLTYIWESLGFLFSFRVGPQNNRLVGDKGPEKKRDKWVGKQAAVRKHTWPRQGIEPKR
jgi:hypothetical protein